MYEDLNGYLTPHLQKNSNIDIEAFITSEINMNDSENISIIGNYKNRPANAETIWSTFGTDSSNKIYYEGYTDSDIVVDGGYEESNVPVAFSSIDSRKKLLFSLEDCFNRFRPRSGINKAIFYGNAPGHYSHSTNSNMMSRPRYYMADKNDAFKYWTSFRTEQVGSTSSTIERGISNKSYTGEGRTSYYIDDAAPFIVYKNIIPVNRVVIKMQTHIGTVNLGNIFNGIDTVPDPFYDEKNTIANRAVPINWKVQYLNSTNSWVDMISFNNSNNSTEPVIPRDGYLELHYEDGSWTVGSQTLSASTPLLTDFTITTPASTQFTYIKGLRIVVDTMSKKDVPFELIELSPRLAMNITDLTVDYSINKVASDLGVSGMPVGQLLASTGSITLADFDDVLNPNNLDSVIGKYVKKNMQIKFYEIVKNVPSPTNLEDYYVPIKTMYAESFPEIKNETRIASISLRDMYFYLESLTAPQTLIADISFSYAIAMVLDSIGFTNYIYLKSNADDDLIIPYFYISPNTTVAEVLQDLAVSTQTATFFDEYNNLVFMSKSYMLANPGERNESDPADEVSLELIGTKDFSKSGRLRNSTAANANLANIIEVSSKNNEVFNDGKIVYTSRYIQKAYKDIANIQVTDEEKVWVYRPALLWEPTALEETKSQNEQTQRQGGFLLTAMALNSPLSSTVPTVSSNKIINNVIDIGQAINLGIPKYNGYFYANGEIINFDAVEYSISQPSVTSKIVGNVTSGSNVISVTSGSTSGISVGDKIVRIGGDGRLGSNTSVTAVTDTTITVVSTATSSGEEEISFVAKVANTKQWISSVSEYRKYFAQLPFNGKMYPTGRIRIFAEPEYTVANGVATLKNGAVIRHGRGQFNTPIVDHNVGLPSWVENNVRGCSLNSKISFTASYKETFELDIVAGSSNKKLYIDSADRKYIRKDQIVTGTGISSGTKVKEVTSYGAELNKPIGAIGTKVTVSGVKIFDYELVDWTEAATGSEFGDSLSSTTLAEQGTRTSLIKNFMSSPFTSENQTNGLNTSQAAKVQSSALVMSGPTFPTSTNPADFLSYTYKPLDGKYKHFGTRMRVIGTQENNEDVYQSAAGAMNYFTATSEDSTVPTLINGGGGGIGIFVNPLTNTGYYFEIAALSVSSIDKYIDNDNIFNLHFFKVVADVEAGGNPTIKAVPKTLWRGLTNIVVDDGLFVGQYRNIKEKNPTVYDISVEYEEIISGTEAGRIKFYLYVNNKLVGTVIDNEPLNQKVQTAALFVRGTSKCMFEHLYALKSNESSNYLETSSAPFQAVNPFNKESEIDEAVSKYSLPAPIQDVYLNGISPISTRSADIYYEEFGTILREVAYLNIKYDKAYPALIARIAPSFNKIKGYAVSGFIADAYGAEFLIFNITDAPLSLEEDTGNYFSILGVTFTQESKSDLTVDEYFKEKSNMADPEIFRNVVTYNPLNNKRDYQSIKNSRILYGKKDFSIDSEYIQSQDAADSLMGWMISKIMTPRKSIGMSIFANPALQLGDIVTINYKSQTDDTVDQIIDPDTRFVIYNIKYDRSVDGPNMEVYLSEIPNIEGVS